MLINSTEVLVTIRKGYEDGSTSTEQVQGWTTNCPHLVITPHGKLHVLTHAPSGACIVSTGTSMPDLYRLAENLTRFDWNSKDLYEAKPDDWDERTEVVKAWYLALDHGMDSDAITGPFGPVRP